MHEDSVTNVLIITVVSYNCFNFGDNWKVVRVTPLKFNFYELHAFRTITIGVVPFIYYNKKYILSYLDNIISDSRYGTV